MSPSDNQLHENLLAIANKYIANRTGYKLDNYIASGGSAAVYKIDTPYGFRALKVCNPNLLNGTSGSAEKHRITLQERLIDKGSALIAETYNIDITETCIIEMEYLPWPSLKDELKKIPDNKVFSLITQLIQAVKHLDALGLVHRDIKPENILVSNDWSQLKLIDFGVIREVSTYDDNLALTDHGTKKPFLATAQYSSPEYLFRLIEPSEDLWKGLTIYQVGAVLHDLLTKRPIFQEEVDSGNRFILAMAVLRKRPSLDTVTNLELNQLKQLTTNCLTKNLHVRLALVSWDDFNFSEESSLQKIKKQLHKRKQLSDLTITDETVSQRDLELRKYNTLNSIFESTRLSLVKELGSFIKLEAISPKDDINFFQIKICLDNELQDLWIKVSFQWQEADEANIANIIFETREDVQSDFDIPAKLIGTADIDGIGQNELIHSICENVAIVIEKQLSKIAN